jgi:uncharacterized protein YndB with AHSA1/START domain
MTPESIVVECELPDAPDKVWRALTEQDLLAAWLMPTDMRPVAGTRFRFNPAAKDGTLVDCEVLEAIPNQLLSWRQSERADPESPDELIDSVVTIELAAMPDGGTRLRVVHEDFERRREFAIPELRCAA